VSAGAGNGSLFESLGAKVVEGGRTMNPSTSDLVRALDELDAEEAVLLPNSANVIMAAEQAAENVSKAVAVVPTRSIQAGLAALVAFDASVPADENASVMSEAVAQVATGGVTVASRGVQLDGVEVPTGAWLGLENGEPVVGGETFEQVAEAVAERLLAEPRSILTLLEGEDVQPIQTLLETLAARHPEVELEVHEGGQPNYALLLSAE
jgi:dihydroxyacetone kinase-like predicted kinase